MPFRDASSQERADPGLRTKATKGLLQCCQGNGFRSLNFPLTEEKRATFLGAYPSLNAGKDQHLQS